MANLERGMRNSDGKLSRHSNLVLIKILKCCLYPEIKWMKLDIQLGYMSPLFSINLGQVLSFKLRIP